MSQVKNIMILHDENHSYFVAFSKYKKLDKSAVKKIWYRTKKNSAPLTRAENSGNRITVHLDRLLSM